MMDTDSECQPVSIDQSIDSGISALRLVQSLGSAEFIVVCPRGDGQHRTISGGGSGFVSTLGYHIVGAGDVTLM